MVLKFFGTVIAIFFSMYAVRKYREFTWGKCKSKKSMKDKTVIITGANTGLGKATALELAKRGAHVILACRNLRESQDAMIEIRSCTKHGKLETMYLDLSSFKSIREFSKNVLSRTNRLDVLINNAGVFNCPFLKTSDGFEMQFGVNHLGHFLLTKLLLNKLKECAPSRVVIVSSELYKKGNIDFENINSEEHYNGSQAYKNSKLANVLFARELSKRVKDIGISVYVVSPGMVYTKLHRHTPISWFKMILLFPIAYLFVRTPHQGCQTILHCAVSEELDNETGYFYRNCQTQPFEGESQSDALAEELWNVSESFTK